MKKTHINQVAFIAGVIVLANSTTIAAPGDIKWHVNLPATSSVQSTPILASWSTGQRLVVGFNNGSAGEVYFIDPQTGNISASTPVNNNVVSSPISDIANPPMIYVCSGGTIYQISVDGYVQKSLPLQGFPIDSTPAIAPDCTFYFNCDNGYLYAVNGNYWQYVQFGYSWVDLINCGNPEHSEDEPLTSSPVIGADGTIYTVGFDSANSQTALFAFAPDGTLLKENDYASILPMSSLTIGPDGTIYVGDEFGGFYGLDPVDLHVKYHFSGLERETTATPVIGSDGTIYIGDESGNFSASTPAGRIRWTFTTGGSIDAAGAITSDGKIWAISSDGNLYSFDAETGDKQSQTLLGLSGTRTASSPIVGPDGTVYVVYNTTIYAIAGYGPLASCGWPCFRGNDRGTGDVRDNRWSSNLPITSYSLILLGPFPGGYESFAFGINDLGTVIGYANGYIDQFQQVFGTSAFSVSGPNYDVLSALGYQLFGSTGSYGYGISRAGDFIGEYLPPAGGGLSGFIDPISGPALTLTPPPPYTAAYPFAISGDGTMVVGYSTGGGGTEHATTWSSFASSGNDFGTLGGGISIARGVNDEALVVGQSQLPSGTYHGFLSGFSGSINPVTDDMGSQAGAPGSSYAYAINNFNQVVGKTLSTWGTTPAFLRNWDMQHQTLSGTWNLSNGTLGTNATAWAINNRGQAVGTTRIGNVSHAFLWLPTYPNYPGRFIDLNTLLTPDQASQWTLVIATSINNAGWIVGYGYYQTIYGAFLFHPN